MPASRRHFCLTLAGLAGTAAPFMAQAQARAAASAGAARLPASGAGRSPVRAKSPWTVAGAPSEGVHYLRLPERATPALPGRIEVIEFFWYECPFCNAFEPALEAWLARLGPDVAFRRVPIWFRPEPFGTQQRLFYALQAQGLEVRLHSRIFAAIHQQRARLRTPEDIAAFMLLNGADAAAFMKAFASPEVQQQADEAHRLTERIELRDVPALLIDGRFLTLGALASSDAEMPSNDRMLDVADALLQRRRRGE